MIYEGLYRWSLQFEDFCGFERFGLGGLDVWRFGILKNLIRIGLEFILSKL
jgi:hypothetical protein